MSTKKRGKNAAKPARNRANRATGARRSYGRARRLALDGEVVRARALYEAVLQAAPDAGLQALIHNDLAVLAAMSGDQVAARLHLQRALACDPACGPAQVNIITLGRDQASSQLEPVPVRQHQPIHAAPPGHRLGRVAILSMLFNWPSTGGGTVHTFELARALAGTGYEVCHIYARHLPWEIGRVNGELPYASRALEFSESEWNPRSTARSCADGRS